MTKSLKLDANKNEQLRHDGAEMATYGPASI